MSYTGERSSLRSNEKAPAGYVHNGNELSLSHPELIEIIKGVLGKGASFRFCAGGNSMHPFIKEGDFLTLTPISGPLSVGDVIAFVHPRSGRLTIHRIIGKNKEIYILKGDNIEISDGQIPLNYMIGKVSKIERMKRRVYVGMGVDKLVIALGSRINLPWRVNRFKQGIISIIGKVIYVS